MVKKLNEDLLFIETFEAKVTEIIMIFNDSTRRPCLYEIMNCIEEHVKLIEIRRYEHLVNNNFYECIDVINELFKYYNRPYDSNIFRLMERKRMEFIELQ